MTQQALDAMRSQAEQTSTARSFTQATLQAQDAMGVLQTLQASGDLQFQAGRYHALPDFEANWARINHYDFLLAEFAPADFVVSAHVEWDSASSRANWENSGCGFVFRMNAGGDHYLTFLGLDGNVYLYRNIADSIQRVGAWYYGAVGRPQGSADLILLSQGTHLAFLVNGQLVHSLEDSTLRSGYLGYALVSGTNKDYGIKCTMNHVQLWVLDTDQTPEP
jgi:hypothetical protein